MKKIALVICIVTLIIFSSCSSNQNKGTIQFLPLSEKDFNYSADSSFIPPQSKEFNKRRQWQDSCMGISFAANAFFIRTKDTFRLGDVINRKTMKLVKRQAPPNPDYVPSSKELNVLTKPCYSKTRFNISIDTFFKSHIALKLQKANKNLDDELNEVIRSSAYTEVENGSWIYLELTDALGKMLDTTKNAEALEYKTALLQPDNMVLIRSAAMTDVSFYVHPQKPISEKLKTLLLQKPLATIEGIDLHPQLFFIDETNIELNFNGYFQLMGQFMKCELR
jgi:hypothetical protein